jgi:hypothetical protein
MTLKQAYYNLGKSDNTKQASLRSLLGLTALGGAAGTMYGLGSKENKKSEALHPSTATYGLIGLQGGLGMGLGSIAKRALGAKGILLPALGGGIGTLLGLNRATAEGRPDLRLKQPGIDYSYNPTEYSLASLSQEANKL